MKKNKIPIWGWAIIILLVVIVLNQKGIGIIPTHGAFIPPPEVATTPTGECSLELDKYLINVGDYVTGTIYNGAYANCEVLVKFSGLWTNIGTYQLDVNGEFTYSTPINIPGVYEILAICITSTESCKTNTEILTVQMLEEPEGPPEIGDIVGSGGMSGILSDGEITSFEIQLTPGEYQFDICAEIERKSSKAVSSCNPTGDLEDWNEFIFLDSYGTVWERNDQIVAGVNIGPNTFGNPDIVGVSWDGINPFKGFMSHYGPCDMNMEMRVTLKVC